MYRCPYCSYTSSFKSSVATHMKTCYHRPSHHSRHDDDSLIDTIADVTSVVSLGIAIGGLFDSGSGSSSDSFGGGGGDFGGGGCSSDW